MTWRSLRNGELRVGLVVRVRPGSGAKRKCTTRDGGVVRQIEPDGTVYVEPDYPDVDEDLEFVMWKTNALQLLIDRA